MEGLLSRYRNLSLLVLLLAGQLLLLAWQIKSKGDTRLIRVWAVMAVTPIARGLDAMRDGGASVIERWFTASQIARENLRLRHQSEQLAVKIQLLEEQVRQGDRAQALLELRNTLPGKSVPTRILGIAPGVQSGVLFIDRGSAEGVMRGMAVVTADGIAGQVVAAYPTASLIMLATSQGFAAGVVSQKSKLRGLLKGDGGVCHVEGIRNEQPLEAGEWFYTSGEDRIFPRGLKVGRAESLKDTREGKQVIVRPAALERDVSEFLVLLDAVHGQIPEPGTPAAAEVHVMAAPDGAPSNSEAPASPGAESGAPVGSLLTEADKLKERYRHIAEGQNFQIGTTPYRAADFNKPPAPASAAPKPDAAKQGPPAAAKPEAPKRQEP